MANILGLAQDLWDIGQEDSSLLAKLKAERVALVLAIRNGSGTGDIVSGSENGASYTKRVGYTVDDRRSALSSAINGLQSGIRPGNISYSRFS